MVSMRKFARLAVGLLVGSFAALVLATVTIANVHTADYTTAWTLRSAPVALRARLVTAIRLSGARTAAAHAQLRYVLWRFHLQ